MKSTRPIAVIQAFGALLVLALLVAGVPWALATFVGWPLPTAVPTVEEIRDGLTGATVTDGTIIKGLALVCWLAWLPIIASTVVEIVAWARGQVAVRLPGAIVQPLVRQLVVTGLFLFGTLRSHPAPTLVSAHVAPAATIREPMQEVTPSIVGRPQHATATEGLITPTCTVRPRDSLWRLAEKHLGDGMRWRELYEINRGVLQMDGRVLADPDIIRPGWVLSLPPDAVNLDPPPVSSGGEVHGAPAPEDPVPMPQGLVSEPAPPAAPIDGSSIHRHDRSDESATANGDEDADASLQPLAGGLLAVGIVGTLGRLRRVQQRRRRPGRAIPMPAGDAADAERQLRRTAVAAAPNRLDLALRAVATLTKDVERLPIVDAVSVTQDNIEILFGEEFRIEDPGPFEVNAGGRAWTLRADVPDLDLERLATSSAAPLPALCAIGGIDDREILLDLESPPTTTIRGGEPAASELLWTIGAGLATSTWTDDLRVIVLGDVPDGLVLLDRVEVIVSLASVLDELESAGSALYRELREAGHSSPVAARAHGDTWTPTIVLLGSPDPDTQRLLEVAHRSSGVAVIALNPGFGDFDRDLLVDGSTLRVEPPGLDVVSVTKHLPSPQLISDLIEVAVVEEPGPSLNEPPCEEAAAVDGGSVKPVQVRGTRVAEPEVTVRVMGAIEIVGSETPFSRRRAEEVVVYLALHPSGADEGRLRTALWPDELPQPGTFNQAVSRARSALGRNNEGELHLPHLASGGLYRVSSTVKSDVDLLKSSFDLARESPTEGSVRQVAEALQLVRGLPFEGTRGYEWAYVEGIVAHIEATVSDAAHFVADWAIANDQANLALEVTTKGLLASPGNEVLYRDRMLAHDVAGNPAGVESTMAELCRFADDLEPYDSVHPATLELYQRLTRRHPSGAAGSVARQGSRL